MAKHLAHDSQKPIHIGIVLVFIAAALYLWWFWQLNARTSALYDAADRQFKAAQVDYIQHVGLKKGKPALTLMKKDPFRADSRWLYVSSKRPLPSDFSPQLAKLTVAASNSIKDPQLHPLAAPALKRLFKKAEKAGFPLMVASAFRSVKEQAAFRKAYAAQYGAAMAEAYVAEPGESEHSTGLAVDVDNADSACQTNADQCSLSPATAAWLAKNAPKYGFIIRYPEDKEKKTGVAYEPWHLRYVGKGAETLAASGLSLDELVEKVDKQSLKQ